MNIMHYCSYIINSWTHPNRHIFKPESKMLIMISKLLFYCSSVFALSLLLTVTYLEHDWSHSQYRSSVSRWRSYPSLHSYNICTVLESQSMDKEAERPDLPLARKVFRIEKRREEGCLTVHKDQRPWKTGLVSSFLPDIMPEGNICNKLLAGEGLYDHENRWIEKTNGISSEMSTQDLKMSSMDCQWVQHEFSSEFHTSKAEKDFPIAYAINIDKDPHQIIRFLKVIYRPHNVYCLHFDLKSELDFKDVFLNIATCLGNVIVPRRIENVYRGWHTLVDAHISCFSDLMLARELYPWRYVITLCGKELPLRTNTEIVSILKPLNGTSSVELVGEDGMDEYKFKWKWVLNTLNGWITEKDTPLPPIPHDLKVYKSWAYVALSLQFVEHLLCSQVGRELRLYMRNVRIPEENLYAMLFMAPNTPGGYKPEFKDKIFRVMSCIWLDESTSVIQKYRRLLDHRKFCAGSNTHNICIVSARDLYKLSYRPGIKGYRELDTYLGTGGAVERYEGTDRGPLFHNKYSLSYDRVAMDCMEMELLRRNKLEYERDCM